MKKLHKAILQAKLDYFRGYEIPTKRKLYL